jgi:hypothetical protein
VTNFHLSDDFFQGNGSSWKKKTEQHGDVKTAQQWILILVQQTLLNHKQHDHHYHRHMMMPTSPFSGLALTHSTQGRCL